MSDKAHTKGLETACENLWAMLKQLNDSYMGEARDVEQYHHCVAALYKLKGLEMLAEYEEEENGSSGRSYGSGYSDRSRPMRSMDPMEAYSRAYGDGGSYDGGSYDDGMSGRRGRSRETGRYVSRDNGASYHSQEEVVQELRDMMQKTRDPELRRCFQRVVSEMEQ